MKEESNKAFESAHREVYELAKKGNPVIQTAIARDVFQFNTAIVGLDEGYRLVKEAACTGYPPALFIQGLFIACRLKNPTPADLSLMSECFRTALDLACPDAKCFCAITDYAKNDIDAQKLRDVLQSTPSLLGMGSIILDRFIEESAGFEEIIRLGKVEEVRLRLQMMESGEALRRQIEGKNSHIRILKVEKNALTKMATSLSASTLQKERDILRSKLAETSQRLTNAELHAAEMSRQLDASIAEAVKGMKEQAEQSQLERDIAIEERDEALHHAENAERRAKHLEQFLRQHGLEPSMAFCDGMMAEERVLASGS